MRGSKSMNRRIAALLAAVLMVPQMPVYAQESGNSQAGCETVQDAAMQSAVAWDNAAEGNRAGKEETAQKDEAYELSAEGQNADGASKQEEPDSESAGNTQGLNVKNEPKQEGLNVKNEPKQEGLNAKDVPEQEEPNAKDASKQEGLNAKDAPNQEGLNAKDESGAEESDTGHASESEELNADDVSETEEPDPDVLTESEEKKQTGLKNSNTEKRNNAKGNIIVDTGSSAVSVGAEDCDETFESDGSYTIQIQEKNPFFPYEVQFTYDGKTVNKWFMEPDDSVRVGGHDFYLSADFDGSEVTQMSLEIGGSLVPVYPQQKEFTNGHHLNSLQHLEKERFQADLQGYTPLELSMVKVGKIFAGKTELAPSDKIVLATRYKNYKVYDQNDDADLSSGGNGYLQVTAIVGEADQLAVTNKMYEISCMCTNASEWLSAEAYRQGSSGTKTVFSRAKASWYSYETDSSLYLRVPKKEYKSDEKVYFSLQPKLEMFENTQVSSIRAFEGRYESAASAEAGGREITNEIIGTNAGNNGYTLDAGNGQIDRTVTMAAYDSQNNVIGCKTVRIMMGQMSSSVSMFLRDENNAVSSYYSDHQTSKKKIERTIYIGGGYSVNQAYQLNMTYNRDDEADNSKVTAAYEGDYASIAAAESAGARNIKDALFDGDSESGYQVNLSRGKNFSIFIGSDGDSDQEVFRYQVKAENSDEGPSSSSYLSFYDLADRNGEKIPAYIVAEQDDSYSEYNYSTILVSEDTDLTQIAPFFSNSKTSRVYAAGSSSPEVSGKSYHDFSNGPLQYTVSAEDGKASKNYWLNIVKPISGAGELYVNSLYDPESDTQVKDGVTVTKREILIDSYHDSRHDIFVANMGTENIGTIAVDVDSDVVELDEYWTFTGKYDLMGFEASQLPGTQTQSTAAQTEGLPKEYSAGMQNLGKIVLKQRAGVEDGTEVTGTLTIRTGSKRLLVMELTGTVGDPVITTKEVPKAVKYVPYGSMIQNSNKYSWNIVSYEIEGDLPKGMVLRENGEIYGVPKKTGSYAFKVKMTNSYQSFAPSERSYTLKVIKNTNKNVDDATDMGYDVTKRIKNITIDASGEQEFISEGTYAEFVAVYLDGDELEKDKDYTSEEGSTKLLIANKTLRRSKNIGAHTIGVEFRTSSGDTLKRAAQNYQLKKKSAPVKKPDSKPAAPKPAVSKPSAPERPAASTGSSNTSTGAASNTSSNANTHTAPSTRPTSSGNNYTYTHTGRETVVRYVVKEGDSLWNIAVRFYGRGADWTKIAADNKNVVQNPDFIKPGDILNIYIQR